MDDEALRALAERVRPAGIVVARFDAAEVETTTFGEVAADDRFEAGSLTKLFTARLLELLVADGVVALDDPAAAHLGPGWRLSPRVTLERLATHRSGLPRLPRRVWRQMLRTPDDPYRDLPPEELRRSLPPRLPRPRTFRYSNFGYALLGHALARAAAQDWAALVQERICAPLGLRDTGTGGDVAQPHDGRGRPVPPWTLNSVAPAGALRSTARDLVTFARAAPHEGLGWMREGDLRWHNGGTGGSSAFLSRDPAGRGVVALANAAIADDLTRAGLA